mgnify:CR=1 FL=1|tara:strand:+ start:309 stop:728 length:420 start_codon:yes stop_codon:yes gene_type:complete
MAYVIYNHGDTPNHFSRITNDENEKTAWLEKKMLVHEISESDFNDIKNNLKFTDGWDGTNIIYTDIVPPMQTQEQLDSYLVGVKEQIEQLVLEGADDAWQTYLNYLNNFDTSTVSFPIPSWEKYCSDNSITFQSFWIRP